MYCGTTFTGLSRLLSLSIWAAFSLGSLLLAKGELVIEAKDARLHVGERGYVVGTVVSTKYATSSKGKPTFLNLEQPHPNQTVTVVIYGENRGEFTVPPEELYRGKRIKVAGKIGEYKGIPEIEVRSPAQIEIVDVSPTSIHSGTPPLGSEADPEKDSAFTLLFNSPLFVERPVATTSSEMGSPLLKEIRQARSTIDFAIYGIRNQPEILSALEEAAKRGVVIRGVVDKDVDGKSYYEDTEELIQKLGRVLIIRNDEIASVR